MKRTRFLTIVGVGIFFCLSVVGFADPLIPVTAGGPSLTYVFTSSSNSAVNVLGTYALSADGRTLQIDFQNQSQGLGMAEFITLIPDRWMPSLSYLVRPPGWAQTDDWNGQCCYFFDSVFRLHLPSEPISPLLPGQSASVRIQFGPGAGVIQSLLPNGQFALGTPGTTSYQGVVRTDMIANASPAPIPEPTTWILIASGLGVVALRRRRKAGK